MENKTPENPVPAPVPEEKKQRHGCLTAYLVFMLIAYIAVIFIYLFAAGILASQSKFGGWAIALSVIIGIFGVVCVIALFRWRKWGFWGLCGVTIVSFIINITNGVDIFRSIAGLIGIAILYGVLHIGDENKGWPQLK